MVSKRVRSCRSNSPAEQIGRRMLAEIGRQIGQLDPVMTVALASPERRDRRNVVGEPGPCAAKADRRRNPRRRRTRRARATLAGRNPRRKLRHLLLVCGPGATAHPGVQQLSRGVGVPGIDLQQPVEIRNRFRIAAQRQERVAAVAQRIGIFGLARPARARSRQAHPRTPPEHLQDVTAVVQRAGEVGPRGQARDCSSAAPRPAG